MSRHIPIASSSLLPTIFSLLKFIFSLIASKNILAESFPIRFLISRCLLPSPSRLWIPLPRLRRILLWPKTARRLSAGFARRRRGYATPWRSFSVDSVRRRVDLTVNSAITLTFPASPMPSVISARASSSPMAFELGSESFFALSSSPGGSLIPRFLI